MNTKAELSIIYYNRRWICKCLCTLFVYYIQWKQVQSLRCVRSLDPRKSIDTYFNVTFSVHLSFKETLCAIVHIIRSLIITETMTISRSLQSCCSGLLIKFERVWTKQSNQITTSNIYPSQTRSNGCCYSKMMHLYTSFINKSGHQCGTSISHIFIFYKKYKFWKVTHITD